MDKPTYINFHHLVIVIIQIILLAQYSPKVHYNLLNIIDAWN